MVTQVDVARELGLDVSTCNKILNRVHGPVFKKETIRAVFATAKRLGYRNDGRRTKGVLLGLLQELIPKDGDEVLTSYLRGVDVAFVRRVRRLLYGKDETFRL